MDKLKCQHPKWTKSEDATTVTDTCDECGETVTIQKEPPTSAPSPQSPIPPVDTQSLKPEKKGAVVVKAGSDILALVPTTMQEAYLFCNKMAQSFNLPPAFYAKPKTPEGMNEKDMPHAIDVATARAMHAMQLGMEVGLPPAQAIQSIIVTNGVGTLWGDTQLALVLSSGKAEYVREYTEGGDMWLDADQKKPNLAYTWICETKRKGAPAPIMAKFSIADAQRAGLWDKRGKPYNGQEGKPSTWITHPNRMGKYKARAFCLRDVYPDVLKGLSHSREEMEGEVIDVTPSAGATDLSPTNPSEKLNAILEKDKA